MYANPKQCGITEIFRLLLKTALGFTHAPFSLVRGVRDSFRSLPIQTVP